MGKIILILVNREAYNNNSRSVDENMNRIWAKQLTESSEWKRAKELLPILNELDYLLDIHSMPIGDELVGVQDISLTIKSQEIFDTDCILAEDMQSFWSLIGYVLSKKKEAYGIEFGNHRSDISPQRFLHNIINYLIYCWSMTGTFTKSWNIWWTYQFINEEICQSNNFTLILPTNPKNIIYTLETNQQLAQDWNISIKNDTNQITYFAIPHSSPKKWDGYGFWVKKLC
jgi:hypothetical protein